MGNPSVNRRSQWGKESSAGTAVSGGKWLQGIMVEPKPAVRVATHRGAGNKFHTHVTRAKEHTTAEVRGETIPYNDLTYLLSSVLGQASGNWTFTLNPSAVQAIETFTVEVGSAVRASRFSYGVCNALSLRFTETEASLQGSMIGRKLEEGVSLTNSPTRVAPVSINPEDVTVSIGDSLGGLTAIDRPLEAMFGISGRHVPKFFLNADDSFTETIEGTPDFTASLVVEHNSVASGFLNDLRAGTQKFLQIDAPGPAGYDFRLRFGFFFTEDQRADNNSDYVDTFTLKPDWESTLGGVEIVLTNPLSGL